MFTFKVLAAMWLLDFCVSSSWCCGLVCDYDMSWSYSLALRLETLLLLINRNRVFSNIVYNYRASIKCICFILFDNNGLRSFFLSDKMADNKKNKIPSQMNVSFTFLSAIMIITQNTIANIMVRSFSLCHNDTITKYNCKCNVSFLVLSAMMIP